MVNVGRGNVIDESVLLEGLKKDIVKGAALDVWQSEPLPKDHEIYQDEKLNKKILNYCHKADCHEL